MDIIMLIILSYALYRMAKSFNISPWQWIRKFVTTFMLSAFGLSIVLYSIYGPNFLKDTKMFTKVTTVILPFTLLWQVLLFFFFRHRIIKYVHELDKLDNMSNTDKTPPPSDPTSGKNEPKKDLSYFR